MFWKKKNLLENSFIIFVFVSGLLYLVLSKLILMALVFAFITITILLFMKQWKLVVCSICISCLFLLWALFLKLTNLDSWSLKKLMDDIPAEYNIRMIVVNLIKSHMDKRTQDFVLLMLLNYRTEGIKQTYTQLLDLGVIHLFVISGFHLGLINNFLKRFCNRYFCFAINFVYAIFLGLPFAVLRVVVTMALGLNKNQQATMLTYSSWAGLVIYTLNPWSVFELSFQLSFIASVVLGITNLFKGHWKYASGFLNSFLINLIVGPIILMINHKINLLTIFYSWLLTPIIIFYYVLSMVLIWFPCMWTVLTVLFNWLDSMIQTLSSLRTFFYLDIRQINSWWLFFYYETFIIICLYTFRTALKQNQTDRFHDNHSFFRQRSN